MNGDTYKGYEIHRALGNGTWFVNKYGADLFYGIESKRKAQ